MDDVRRYLNYPDMASEWKEMDYVRRNWNNPDMAGEWREPSVDAHSFP